MELNFTGNCTPPLVVFKWESLHKEEGLICQTTAPSQEKSRLAFLILFQENGISERLNWKI